MKPLFVITAAILALAGLAACGTDEAGQARLKGLTEGMSMSDALEQMGQGPLTTSLSDTVRVVNGFRRMRYFINGATYDVLYARDLPGDVKEPLLQANETPVVFREGKLLGWGWRYYVDEAIAKLQLPTPLRAIDTMTTPTPPTTPRDSMVKNSAAPPPAVTRGSPKQS